MVLSDKKMGMASWIGSTVWTLIVIAFVPLRLISAASLNRDHSGSYDQSTYEPSMYYKMYAAHYEVTTYEYTYPRIHADAISYSSYETDSPIYITTSPRHRHVGKHTKKTIGKGHANPSYHAKAPNQYVAPFNYYEKEFN